VSRAGDTERMDAVRSVLEAFRDATREAGGKRSIACLKRALRVLGVIQSDAVAPGTAPLGPEGAARFDAAFERVLQLSRERIGAPWISLVPGTRS